MEKLTQWDIKHATDYHPHKEWVSVESLLEWIENSKVPTKGKNYFEVQLLEKALQDKNVGEDQTMNRDGTVIRECKICKKGFWINTRNNIPREKMTCPFCLKSQKGKEVEDQTMEIKTTNEQIDDIVSGKGRLSTDKKEWVSVESLVNKIKNMPDNNVKSELMSLLGHYVKNVGL